MKKLLSLLIISVMIMTVGIVSAETYQRPCDVPEDICTWTQDSNPLILPLGSEDNYQCGLGYNTPWEINTLTTATCTFDGDDLGESMFYVSINNDIVECRLNGDVVFSSIVHEGCAEVDPRDGLSVEIIPAEGENVLVCDLEDRGGMTHFDACLIGEYEESICEVDLFNPEDGSWVNSHVPLEWEYTEDCQVLDQELYYHEGSCDAPGESLAELDNSWQREYLWETTPFGEGEQCVCIYAEQRDSLPGVEDCSGVLVDLTPPEVSEAYVSSGPEVSCEEGESCKSYITDESRISFACTDAGSGVSEKLYRYRVNSGDWTAWNDATGGFYLPEESSHEVEYYCIDNVGKEAEHRTTIFIVDLTAPEFSKVVGDPKVEAYEIYDWYVNTDTEICVTAEDQEPHPVGGVMIRCMVDWTGQGSGQYELDLDENGCFNYQEDSFHRLSCQAVDALGNMAEYEEFDIVDNQAPITTLDYQGPFYQSDGLKWIDGVSTVVLSAEDPEPHPVDVDETQYRVSGALADRFCEPQNCANWMNTLRPDMGEWQTYTDPFSMEESCHVIEYRSLDLLGNEEEIQWDCVYVDKTAPEPIKEVGEPAHDCNGVWEILTGECEDHWDWLITMDTEIEISCEDQEPHPSGVQEICYRVIYDGELVEEQGADQDGYLCVSYSGPLTIQFHEECEHQLDFYCVDNVEKTSEVDSEIFKVEGRAFDIDLYKKWNLISIPFTLISSNIEEVFDSVSENVEVVWSYDEAGWHVYSPEGPSDLEEVLPGYGYWIKMEDDAELTVGGSLLGPAPGVPPSRRLQEGWNLIGHYGTSPREAYCSLFSLIDTTIGYPRWSSLIGYNAQTDHFIPLDAGDITRPGRGYWIEMDVEDTYNPATACWGLP